jgi:hypothetical protein
MEVARSSIAIGNMETSQEESLWLQSKESHVISSMLRLEKEDVEYLDAIAELTSEMKPFVELESLVKGCPDPTRYASDQKDC